MSSQSKLVNRIKAYNPHADEKLITKAFYFSKKAHQEQLRASGEPYFMHPLAVAHILIDLKLDVPTIITGLLHDTVEDTFVTHELVEKEFSAEIALLVDGVTRLNKIDLQTDNLRHAEDFRKFFLALSQDIRILLVKIADRLHNLRTLEHVSSKASRLAKAHETLEVYAPLTERIGIHTIKDEMQDIAFRHIYPEVRESIIQRVGFLKEKAGGDIIARIINELVCIFKDKNIECRLFGREKTPYSIWMKMQKDNISFEQLYDVMAFRVIVKNTEDCYVALGIIHQHFHMIPKYFADYISIPKNNGYQSIHTTVLGPEKQKIEIQIRSEEMHETAEYGIAAHWCYKEGVDIKGNLKNYRWINDLAHSLKEGGNSEEFFDNTRLEMYRDQVFCFSPKGDLTVLPAGATAIDFAYAIHSEVGNSCVGVKVNGVIAPLRTVLQNGDQVEVICSEGQKPSENWDDFVVTSKAKAQIKKFVRLQKREQYLLQGEESLSKFFYNKNCAFNEQVIKEVLPIFAKQDKDDLFISVGEKVIRESDVFHAAYPDYIEVRKKKRLFGFLRKKKKSKIRKKYKEKNSPIKGLIADMEIQYGTCCFPVPGDSIVGALNAAKNIDVHRSNCRDLKRNKSKSGRISLSWVTDSQIKDIFVTRLIIVVANELNVISKITKIISDNNINLSNLDVLSRSKEYLEMHLDIEIKNVKQLYNIKALLRSMKIVYSVKRP